MKIILRPQSECGTIIKYRLRDKQKSLKWYEFRKKKLIRKVLVQLENTFADKVSVSYAININDLDFIFK